MLLRHAAPVLVALCAVLPLVASEVWTGFRVAVSDPLLSVISPTEQPLSVRSPGGVWAVGLTLAWFGLAYWHRRVSTWEVVLVLAGGVAVLIRLGNAWLDALALVAPLTGQMLGARPRGALLLSSACVSLLVAALTGALTRPPELSPGASKQIAATPTHGTVLADWRWAGQLQHQLDGRGHVLAANGLAAEPSDFWFDYLLIAQGHQRWAELLSKRQVDMLVLDASDQQRAAADVVRTSSAWHVIYDADGTLVAQRIGL